MREESFQICSGVLELADYHSDSDLLEMQFHSEWPHGSNFTLEYYTREHVIDWSKQCGGTLKGWQIHVVKNISFITNYRNTLITKLNSSPRNNL